MTTTESTPIVLTVVFDGPHRAPAGGYLTRVVVLDQHGCEMDWFSIDSGDAHYAPTAEHPDRDFLGWPEGIALPFGFSNSIDEGWACPSYEAAMHACLLETAVRIDQGWYSTPAVQGGAA